MSERTSRNGEWVKLLLDRGYAWRAGSGHELAHPGDVKLHAWYDPSTDELLVSAKLKDQLLAESRKAAGAVADHEQDPHWRDSAEHALAAVVREVQAMRVRE